MTVDARSRVAAGANVLTRVVDGELVIMSLATDAYFGLDGVGRRLWGLLGEQRTVGDAVDVVAAEYGEPVDRVMADAQALLAELLAEQLVEVVPPDGA